MEKFKGGVAMVGTLATYIFGGWDTALVVLCVFMCLDYITGVLRGVIAQKVSSSVGFKGIAKKAVIFVVLIVAVLLGVSSGKCGYRTLRQFNPLFPTG